MCIEELRKKIDKIDDKIINLLSERLKYAIDISKYKKQNNIKIKQENREKQIFDRIEKLAEQKNISVFFVKKLYRQIIDETVKAEEDN